MRSRFRGGPEHQERILSFRISSRRPNGQGRAGRGQEAGRIRLLRGGAGGASLPGMGAHPEQVPRGAGRLGGPRAQLRGGGGAAAAVRAQRAGEARAAVGVEARPRAV
uniref:Uncharacterized protein n=1 Tax=Arundo donax TaxID=35708 RepID=A0A0A9DQ94_ARUDO